MEKQTLTTEELPNHLLFDIIKITILLLFLMVNGFAQSNLEPKRGFTTNNPYMSSDIETINSANGNLLLNIPLASLPPGRGGNPGAGVNLIYNSKHLNKIRLVFHLSKSNNYKGSRFTKSNLFLLGCLIPSCVNR